MPTILSAIAFASGQPASDVFKVARRDGRAALHIPAIANGSVYNFTLQVAAIGSGGNAITSGSGFVTAVRDTGSQMLLATAGPAVMLLTPDVLAQGDSFRLIATSAQLAALACSVLSKS